MKVKPLHDHNGSWSPDSKRLVYTHDQDYGDIYELVREQPVRRLSTAVPGRMESTR